MDRDTAAKMSRVVDVITMLVSLIHPVMVIFAVIVFGARRWPYACEGILDVFNVEDITPWMLAILPGAESLIVTKGGDKDGDEEDDDEEDEEDGGPQHAQQNVLAAGVTTALARGSLVERLKSGMHLLFIGHTGGGKTTLMHCIAVMWAMEGRKVIVWDPDAAPGLWSGCDVYGGGDEWEEMSANLLVLHNMLRVRRQLRKKGIRTFEPLYIVWDEVQDIIKHVNGARDFFEDIARRGRKLNMHIILGVQDKLVKTLKLEGQSDLRKNFDVVEVFLDGKVRKAHYTEHDGDRTEEYTVPQLQNLDDLIVTLSDEDEIPAALRPKPPSEADSLLAGMLAATKKVSPVAAIPSSAPPTNSATPSQAEFLALFCYVDPGARVQAGMLYKAYASWCRTQGVEPITNTAFGMKLTELNYDKRRDSKGNHYYHGIGLMEANAVRSA